MILSNRLYMIAKMVGVGSALADIGTDHAYIPIYLAQQGIIDRAIAADIGTGPLKRAYDNIRRYNMVSKIETRLSDGLYNISSKEVDTVLIAGMGSELMLRILDEAKHFQCINKHYILSPHSEWWMCRRYLREHGYRIVDEDMVIDEGKYYIAISAIVDSRYNYEYADRAELYDRFGYHLLQKKSNVLRQYLYKEHSKHRDILDKLSKSNNSHKKREEIENYIRLVEEALYEMQ